MVTKCSPMVTSYATYLKTLHLQKHLEKETFFLISIRVEIYSNILITSSIAIYKITQPVNGTKYVYRD